jgi:hypothetical protein
MPCSALILKRLNRRDSSFSLSNEKAEYSDKESMLNIPCTTYIRPIHTRVKPVSIALKLMSFPLGSYLGLPILDLRSLFAAFFNDACEGLRVRIKYWLYIQR